MDITKTKAICVYPNNRNQKSISIVGGVGSIGYYERNFQLLLRWGNILDEAETKASELYTLLKDTTSTISSLKICILVQDNEPMFLGTDSNGVYEYSIDVKMYYENK